MEFIDNLRKKVGYFILSRRIRKQQRQRSYNNFDSAKTVGIIFNATQQEAYITARNFMNLLTKQNIDVHALGYVKNQEAISYFPAQVGITFFSLKNLNWYYKPNNKAVDAFYEKPFDILIDLSLDVYLQVLHVVGLSRAKLKIGHGDVDSPYYDFILKFQPEKTLTYYIEQIRHYMSAIKKA